MNEPQLGLLVRELYNSVIEIRQATVIEQKQSMDGELWGRFDAVICAYREIQIYMEKLFPWLEK